METSKVEPYEDMIKRLPNVLEAYARDAKKYGFWRGDSGLANALEECSKFIRNHSKPVDVESLKEEIMLEFKDRIIDGRYNQTRINPYNPPKATAKGKDNGILICHVIDELVKRGLLRAKED